MSTRNPPCVTASSAPMIVSAAADSRTFYRAHPVQLYTCIKCALLPHA
eukprot:COSAG05_NODE_1167_length_5631_cov_3.840383_3_plen_48_part_00